MSSCATHAAVRRSISWNSRMVAKGTRCRHAEYSSSASKGKRARQKSLHSDLSRVLHCRKNDEAVWSEQRAIRYSHVQSITAPKKSSQPGSSNTATLRGTKDAKPWSREVHAAAGGEGAAKRVASHISEFMGWMQVYSSIGKAASEAPFLGSQRRAVQGATGLGTALPQAMRCMVLLQRSHLNGRYRFLTLIGAYRE